MACATYMSPEICAYWNYKSFYINLYPMVLDLPLGTGIVDILKKLFVDPNQYEGQGTMD